MRTPEPPNRGLRRHEALAGLSREHHQALAVARTLRRTLRPSPHRPGPGPHEAASQYLKFFASEMTFHFLAEEEALFPSLARHGYAADELLAQHARVRELTGQVARETASGAPDARLLFELGELIERHVRLEERDAFEHAQSHIPEPELREIGRAIAAVEAGARRSCDVREPR
jgi:hemerythrin-like domain-containing protein